MEGALRAEEEEEEEGGVGAGTEPGSEAPPRLRGPASPSHLPTSWWGPGSAGHGHRDMRLHGGGGEEGSGGGGETQGVLDMGESESSDPWDLPIPSAPAMLHPAACHPRAHHPVGAGGDMDRGPGSHGWVEEAVAERVGQARLAMREGEDGAPHFRDTAPFNHMG